MSYIFSAKEMRECDRKAIEELGIPGIILMENAARFTATLIEGTGYRKACVLCGSGNNGGDGYAIARHLNSTGWQVEIIYTKKPSEGENYENFKIAESLSIPMRKAKDEVFNEYRRRTVFVDALLGTGLDGEVRGLYSDLIGWMNFQKDFDNLLVSVDIPSGLSADTGEVLGVVAESDLVATYGGFKRGFFQNFGLNFLDMTFSDPITMDATILRSDAEIFELPVIYDKPEGNHKYNFGSVAVIGGSRDYSGAPNICGNGLMASGAGMVYRVMPEGVKSSPVADEVIDIEFPSKGGYFSAELSEGRIQFLKRLDGIVIGPGLGKDEGARDFIAEILKHFHGKIVVDADGISPLFDLFKKGYVENEVVITPHTGEFKRIFPEAGTDNFKSLMDFAGKHEIPVLLKGGRAYFGDGLGHVYVCPEGTPYMARGGTGDGLSGLLAGLWVQGYSLYDAVNLSTYLIARTAEILEEENMYLSMTINDILENLHLAVEESDEE